MTRRIDKMRSQVLRALFGGDYHTASMEDAYPAVQVRTHYDGIPIKPVTAASHPLTQYAEAIQRSFDRR